MYSSSVFCVFATTFVLLQSTYAHHHKKHEYNHVTEVDCMEYRTELMKTMQGAICKPYPKLVPLKPMPSYEFHPAIVSVNRCDGNCPTNACMPTKTVMKKVPIKYTGRLDGGMARGMCGVVEVEEHVRCKCMCIQKEEDCNPETQVYMRERCACACQDNEIKKQECQAKTGMLWDDENCTCSCTELDLGCTSGQVWNRDICSCK